MILSTKDNSNFYEYKSDIQDENIHNTLIKNNIISKYKNIPDNLEKNLFLLLYQNNTNIFISKF